MLDIPEDAVRAVDASDMMGQVRAYPDLLERAVEGNRDPLGPLPRTPREVLVVGMGGSAIGGDYLATWLDAKGATPAFVSRAYELPRWVGRDTLVLAFSYSGTTEETLAAFAAARDRGAMLAAVSTGGRLEEMAAAAKAPFARVEAGHQPRVALPLMFGTGGMLLDRLGLLEGEAPLRRAAAMLREAALDVAPDVPADKNEAKRTALALQDTVTAVYASGVLAPAARRFANQLNENAKVLAFHGVMPEMNHNELVGWAGDDDLDRFTCVFLRHGGEHAQARTRFDFTARLIQSRGGRVVQAEARGEGPPERLLTASLMGDAVSVYLAALRRVDPTPVDVIAELKARVGGSGFSAAIR